MEWKGNHTVNEYHPISQGRPAGRMSAPRWKQSNEEALLGKSVFEMKESHNSNVPWGHILIQLCCFDSFQIISGIAPGSKHTITTGLV